MKKAIISATLMLAVYVSYGSSYGGYPYYSNSAQRYYSNSYYYPQTYSYYRPQYYQPQYYSPQYYGGYYSSNNGYYSSYPSSYSYRSAAFPDPNRNSRNGSGGLAGLVTGITNTLGNY